MTEKTAAIAEEKEIENGEMDEELETKSEDDDAEDETKSGNEDTSDQASQDDLDSEVEITIGDEEPEKHEPAPDWVKELRKQNREDKKRIRELESRLEEKKAPESTLGQKPTLESFDYDTDKFDHALSDWYEKKRQIDDQKAKQKAEQERQEQEWKGRLDEHERKKSELKARDFEDAEFIVQNALDQTQQGIIIHGADNSAQLFYALGKNQKKLSELAQIKDPVKFSFAIAKLETQLKVNKRTPPPPESKVVGSGSVTGTVDGTLDRLRKEAEKTGDYSKVHAYKREKRASA